ncbi:MAG: glycoside hydrolase family 127 protein [Oscillospiraceae bacterium]|jgi:DUF1680 family protein|nr:glycoside hydrolase family 127 protein [Oscillospiraceae bacterium]
MSTRSSLTSFPLKSIQINDLHWNKYIRLVSDAILPYQWRVLNDQEPDAAPSHCLQNFRIAAGECGGKRQGAVFVDSDVAKWLEAVSYSLETHPDKKLETTADRVIDLLGRAQCPDGYLNTYFTLVEPENRWKNLTEGHELYTAGHFIEAAVAYYRATGKEKFLKMVCRFADLICKTFGGGEGQIHGYPGHEEIELALVKLYRVTKDRKYLDTVKYFVDARGQKPNYFLQETERKDFHHLFEDFRNYAPVYSQSDRPVREQTKPEGHAVRATYLYCAMADLAAEYQDNELLQCCKTIWNNMVRKQMYLTGSIGVSAYWERFTTDYDLPNDRNYSETCASVGLALFGMRMGHITRDASYFDIVERALYNTICAGISLAGNRYFYVNPLEVWPDNCLDHTSMQHVKPVRQKWFDVACCPTNVARTLASLGQYLYSTDGESLYVNLWIQNEAHVTIRNDDVTIKMQTDFPKTPQIHLSLSAKGETEFPIYFRIPDYAENYEIRVDGRKKRYSVQNHYACLSMKWKNEKISILFDMPAKLVSANPAVRADSNKVAIVCGPEVFCLEEVDNFPNLSSVVISRFARLTKQYNENLFGGTTVIRCAAEKISASNWNENELYKSILPVYEKVTLTAVPYAYWCNRTPGEMIVWIHAKS